MGEIMRAVDKLGGIRDSVGTGVFITGLPLFLVNPEIW